MLGLDAKMRDRGKDMLMQTRIRENIKQRWLQIEHQIDRCGYVCGD